MKDLLGFAVLGFMILGSYGKLAFDFGKYKNKVDMMCQRLEQIEQTQAKIFNHLGGEEP